MDPDQTALEVYNFCNIGYLRTYKQKREQTTKVLTGGGKRVNGSHNHFFTC